MEIKKKEKRSFKSILRYFFLIFISFVVGINIYTINASRIVGNAVPMPFGIGAAVVLSGSMEPVINVDDLVIVVKTDNFEVGDIIVFQEGRIAITHRIVEINDEYVITRGEANNTNDTPLSYEQIKGKVIMVIPYVGYVIHKIQTPLGTFLIIGLAIMLFELSFINKKEQDNNELEEIKREIQELKEKNMNKKGE